MTGRTDRRRGNGWLLASLGGMIAFLLLALPAAKAQEGAADPFRPQAPREMVEEVKSRFIFVFDDSVPRGSVPEWAEALVREHGGQVIHRYSAALKGFAARMAPEAAARLAGTRFIAYHEPDQVFWAVAPPAGKGKPPRAAAECTGETIDWGVARVGGPVDGSGLSNSAWVIDTGVDLDHPDLIVDTARAISHVGKNANDGYGHGTHVAGIIAAIGGNNCGTAGVAAGATVVPVKVLGNNGSGFLSDVIAGVDDVAREAAAGDVANMSLGGGPSNALDQAVVAAAGNGVFFALAAGNESDWAGNHSPARANHANVFTVSAIDRSDVFAGFSNFGNPPVDYAAPGVSILSLYKDGGTATYSGTSMAAPHVAGILLLRGGSVATCGSAAKDPADDPDPIACH